MPNSEEKNGVVTLQEARDYCGADIEDDTNDRLLKRLISLADQALQGSLGEEYPRDDERAKQLALFIIDEWYNNGAKSQKMSSAIQRMINSFELQIKVEMRRKNDG